MTDIFGQKSRKTQTRNYWLINKAFSLVINSDPKKHALSNEHLVICQSMTLRLDTRVCYK